MGSLSEHPERLRRDGRPPSQMSQYLLVLKMEDGGITLTLTEEPSHDVLHTWGMPVDPDLDLRSQVTGLLHKAIEDLKEVFERFRIQIKRIDLEQDHLPLFHASGLLSKQVVQARGGTFYNTRPGGLDEDEAEHELTRFNRVKVFTEGTPRF